MENENRKKSKKLFSFRDLILALTVLAAAALLYFLFPRGEGNIAVIEQDGRELYRVVLSELSQPVSFEIPGEYPAVIVAEKDDTGIIIYTYIIHRKKCLRQHAGQFFWHYVFPCLSGQLQRWQEINPGGFICGN